MADRNPSYQILDVTDMVADRGRRPVTLVDLLRIPLRRWSVVVAVALLSVVGVAGYLWVPAASYTATAVVVVRPVVTDPFSFPSAGADRAVNMNVESGIASGIWVVEAVAAATGGDSEEARERLEIEIPVGAQVLRFNFTASTSTGAAAGANAAATAYLKVREGMFEQQREKLLSSYDDSLAAINKQRTEVRRRLPGSATSSSNPPPGVTAALDHLRSLNEQAAQLSQQRAKIASVDVTPGSVTRTAREPVPSNRDRALLVMLAGLLGGALFGVVASHVREATDRRVRSAPQAREATGLPMLGAIRAHRWRTPAEVAAADVGYVALAVAEQSDALRARPIVLISTHSGEGRAALAVDLAAALARQGRQVYIGDAAGELDQMRTRLLAQPGAQAATPPPAPAVAPPTHAPNSPPAPAEERHGPAPVGAWNSAANSGAGGLATLPGSPGRASRDLRPGPRPDIRGRGFDAVHLGGGAVLIGVPRPVAEGMTVLLNAPAAESDETGVRAARDGAALVVVARDRTRVAELRRLVDRLRTTGGSPFGFVLVSGED